MFNIFTKRWEYQSIHQRNELDFIKGVPIKEDASKRHWGRDDFYKKLNELGNDGWELIHLFEEKGISWKATLKRQRGLINTRIIFKPFIFLSKLRW